MCPGLPALDILTAAAASGATLASLEARVNEHFVASMMHVGGDESQGLPLTSGEHLTDLTNGQRTGLVYAIGVSLDEGVF